MHFYKWVRYDHTHFGHHFVEGLNTDKVPFNPSDSGKPGGFHYSREDILKFMSHGSVLYQVDIPENTPTYEDPNTNIRFWKSKSIILSNPRPRNLKTIIELVLEGANPRVCDDSPLIIASNYGWLDLVEYFISCDADINAQDGSPLKYAMVNRRMDVVQCLMNHT